MEALAAVGLAGREQNRSNQLSGGQQQRVAVARSLINNPSLILADEPTGNLDSRTAAEVMEIFQSLNRERGITIVLVTHEQDIADYAHNAPSSLRMEKSKRIIKLTSVGIALRSWETLWASE